MKVLSLFMVLIVKYNLSSLSHIGLFQIEAGLFQYINFIFFMLSYVEYNFQCKAFMEIIIKNWSYKYATTSDFTVAEIRQSKCIIYYFSASEKLK